MLHRLTGPTTRTWLDVGWNATRDALRRFFPVPGTKVAATKVVEAVDASAARPEQKSFQVVAFFSRRVGQVLRSDYFNGKSPLIQNAKNGKSPLIQNAKKNAFQPKPGATYPSFKYVVTKLFQLGFIGVVCTHQESGNGFLVAKVMDREIQSLLGAFKKGQERSGDIGDDDSDIIILEDDDSCSREGSTQLPYKMRSAMSMGGDSEFVMSMKTNEKLKQLEPMVVHLVNHVNDLERELAERSATESELRSQLEEERMRNDLLQKENEKLEKREKLMKDSVSSMSGVLRQISADWNDKLQSNFESISEVTDMLRDAMHEECSDDNKDEDVLQTFVLKKSLHDWALLG